jgi:hypothetical protein
LNGHEIYHAVTKDNTPDISIENRTIKVTANLHRDRSNIDQVTLVTASTFAWCLTAIGGHQAKDLKRTTDLKKGNK